MTRTVRSEVSAAREQVSVIKSLLAGVDSAVATQEAVFTATAELLRAAQSITGALAHTLTALDRALQLNEQEEERG